MPSVLTVVLALTLSSFAAAKENSNPFHDRTLSRDYESLPQGAYIRKIVDEHERTFPKAFRYSSFSYTDRFQRFGYVQQKLLTILSARADFNEAINNREPMTDMTITVVRGETSDTDRPTVSPEALRYLRQQIPRSIHQTNDLTITATLDNLKQQISELWIREIGWVSHTASEHLAAYILAKSFLSREPDLTLAELQARLSKLEPTHLDYLKDPLNYEEHLPEIYDYARAHSFLFKVRMSASDPLTILANGLDYIYGEIHQRLYGFQKIKAKLVIGATLQIKEVHPNIAIFRGYVGNDCATCYSPGFVFTPYDRYYYVFDDTGKSLGYVGLSFVEMAGERTLYIHTIQGPDISYVQTQMIMRAFAQLAPHIGATQAALSMDSNIGSNVNYEPIRRAMWDEGRALGHTPVIWLDENIRRIIVEHGDSTLMYDDPKRNGTGRILPIDDTVKIDVEQRPFEPRFTEVQDDLATMHCNVMLRNGW